MKHKHSRFEITMRTVYVSAFLLLLTSVVLTIAFWFRWYYALPSLLFTVFASYKACQWIVQETMNDKPLQLDASLIVILLLIPIWLIIVGMGGFIGQEQFDNSYRNAVLYELVNNPWPVTQTVDGQLYYLSYYFTYWLPVALIGKLFHSMTAAYIGLVIYAWIWISLTIMMVVHFCGQHRKLLVGVLIMCFMPPTIINKIIFQNLLGWYHNTCGIDPQICGSPTMLYNCTYIYNQTLPIVMAIPMMIRLKKHPGIVAMCLAMIFYYGPLEALPLTPVVGWLVFRSIKCFTTPELWSSVIMAGLIAFFFAGNTNGSHLIPLWLDNEFSIFQDLVMFSAYIFVSIMIFLPFLWHWLGHNIYFWILTVSTLGCSLLMPSYGNYDLGWKCPVALMFIFNMGFCKLCSKISWQRHKKECSLLCIMLIAGIFSCYDLYKSAAGWTVNYFFNKDKRIARSESRYGKLFEYDRNDPIECIVSPSFIKQANTPYSKYLMPLSHNGVASK